MMDLTKEEKNAINTLKRLEKRWPESLWLFSASGSLWVMKKDENGNRALIKGTSCHGTENDRVDPDYEVEHIKIENDGGDW